MFTVPFPVRVVVPLGWWLYFFKEKKYIKIAQDIDKNLGTPTPDPSVRFMID